MDTSKSENIVRKKSWGQHGRSYLDVVIEKLRFLKIRSRIGGGNVLDLGCGYNANLLKSVEKNIKRGIGIDISTNKNLNSKKIKLINSNVDKKINLPSGSFDTMVSLAVIEHLSYPEIMLEESYRLLKNGGKLIATTPSRESKPILEFLAIKAHLISSDEIKDHKRYYDKKSLVKALVQAGFKKAKIEVKYFELGLNIMAVATK